MGALVVGLLIGACQTTSDGSPIVPTVPTVAGPTSQQEQLSLRAMVLRDSCVAPGDMISPGPAVIVSDALGRPRANVPVSFTVTRGGGTLSTAETVSDSNGVARAGTWRMGTTADLNLVTAALQNGTSLTIGIQTALAARVIAIFQLLTVGGQPLPQTYSGGGSSWTITGGHYYLGDNGTYAFGYEFGPTEAPATICSNARYVSGSVAIDFFLADGSYPQSQFYAQRNGHFARGALDGSTMSVKYEDFIDFEDEVYELVAGAPAPALSGAR